jgi:hypothetical protein
MVAGKHIPVCRQWRGWVPEYLGVVCMTHKDMYCVMIVDFFYDKYNEWNLQTRPN